MPIYILSTLLQHPHSAPAPLFGDCTLWHNNVLVPLNSVHALLAHSLHLPSMGLCCYAATVLVYSACAVTVLAYTAYAVAMLMLNQCCIMLVLSCSLAIQSKLWSQQVQALQLAAHQQQLVDHCRRPDPRPEWQHRHSPWHRYSTPSWLPMSSLYAVAAAC